MKRANFENYLALARHLQNAAHMSTPVEVSKLCSLYHISHDGITKDFIRGLDLNRPSEDVARDLIQVGVDYRARKAAPAEDEPRMFPEAVPAAASAPTAAETMQSLYNLTENLLAIYDALEENGGELTDELAAALDETDQAIALKADHYASFIRIIRDRAAAADAEIKRLQTIKRVAQNAEKAIQSIGEFAATLPDYVKVTASISKTAIKEADFPEGVLPAGVSAVETQSITIR